MDGCADLLTPRKAKIPVERWWNVLQKDDLKMQKMILARVGTRAFMHLPLHGKWIWLLPKWRASMPFEISGDSWNTIAKRGCHPTPPCGMWFSLKWRIIASACFSAYGALSAQVPKERTKSLLLQLFFHEAFLLNVYKWLQPSYTKHLFGLHQPSLQDSQAGWNDTYGMMQPCPQQVRMNNTQLHGFRMVEQ